MKKMWVFILFIFLLAGCSGTTEYTPISKYEKKYEYNEEKQKYVEVERGTVGVNWKN